LDRRRSGPVSRWHGFLSTACAWRDVAPALAKVGLAVLIPDMRGYGDSDKAAGNDGYDARSLAEEGRALVAAIGFGKGKPLIHAAHDMGALPALIWTADHPDEVAGLLYIEAPVMLGPVLRQVFSYTPQAMAQGSMWWWILPLAPGVPERLIVGNERAFLTWFYEGDHVVNHAAITPEAVDEYLRTFAGKDGVLGSMGIYRAAFASIDRPAARRSISPANSCVAISRDERRLANIRSTPPEWRNQMTNILFVGQKPETVDFSDPSLPPGFDAEKINAGIALGVKKIEEHGWKGDTCMITPDAAGSAMLEKALAGADYDCVVIGGGMRLPPKGLVLFETVVNIIHKSAPNATIAFNTRPEDTADAAARQVKAA
jgi:pimeloyl-ACP methyl ester carboxylesterase